jgi:hypothetical protein
MHNTLDKQTIVQELNEWSNRKQSMFSNPKYIDIAVSHIENTKFV